MPRKIADAQKRTGYFQRGYELKDRAYTAIVMATVIHA